LIGRLEEAQVAELVVPTQEKPAAPPSNEIEYDDFARVSLRVGKVLNAERVPKADKLIKLSVDVGEGQPRTIVSGIALAYAPEQLVGRNVVVVMNLKPRKLMGIESKGMLLTAGPGGKDLALLDPGAQPAGAEVK
jgi:methionyl-tRNA synthetase